MSRQGDAAYDYFLKGYNCSQCVVAAFAPELGLSEELALRLAVGFGGGVGRLREVCGAFCGAVSVIGLAYGDPTNPKDKSRIYGIVQQLAEEYRARNGGDSIICRDLLVRAGLPASTGGAAEPRTAEYYRKRPCPELCRLAADLCAEYLEAHPEGRYKGCS
jgi:C_GCAxxG_C_C family probable redox protein